jgi:hypothetical protein
MHEAVWVCPAGTGDDNWVRGVRLFDASARGEFRCAFDLGRLNGC